MIALTSKKLTPSAQQCRRKCTAQDRSPKRAAQRFHFFQTCSVKFAHVFRRRARQTKPASDVRHQQEQDLQRDQRHRVHQAKHRKSGAEVDRCCDRGAEATARAGATAERVAGRDGKNDRIKISNVGEAPLFRETYDVLEDELAHGLSATRLLRVRSGFRVILRASLS